MGGFEEVRLRRAADQAWHIGYRHTPEARRAEALAARKRRVEAWFADRMGMPVEEWRRVSAESIRRQRAAVVERVLDELAHRGGGRNFGLDRLA